MIYFDSAATTQPLQGVIDTVTQAISVYGNPSAVHTAGITARRLLESARKNVAKALCANTGEITFTSGGTESNNTAIFGLAKLRKRRSMRIITSDSEHPSVSAPLAALAEDGWEIVKIPTVGGVLSIGTLEKELQKGCAFVAIMYVNNETGAKYDLAAIRQAIDKSGCGAPFYCDCVQGFLKTDTSNEIVKNCDVAGFSAHKIGGLKGVGGLYIKSGIRLPAFIRGGGQENGLRSGTENLLGILAFSAACEGYNRNTRAYIADLYNYTVSRLAENKNIVLHIPKSHVNSILLISVPGIKSEVMLNALSLRDVCVSAGSACSARQGINHAMAAYGLEKQMLDSAIRISFGPHNTKAECDILLNEIDETIKRLKR